MGTVRFLLALCVVVTHAKGSTILGVSLLSGITAVQCFYVISGFLITMVLNERQEYQNVYNFYLSRYLRLWPTYILVATLTLIFFKYETLFVALPALASWPDIAFIAFSNLTLFFQDWFLFVRFDGGHLVPTSAFGLWEGAQANQFLLVPQCWSIGVELVFYAISPFVCRRWWSAALLFAFGVIVRVLVASLHPPALDPWLYRFAPSEMMMFGAGALAYFAGRVICPIFPLATKIACAACLILTAFLVLGNDATPSVVMSFRGVQHRFLILDWPVLLFTAVAVAPLFYGSRQNRFDQLLGELSYPMYVSHIFISSLTASLVPPSLQGGNLLYVVCVIFVSLLLVFFVIVPLDKVRKRFGARIPDVSLPHAGELRARHESA